MGIRVGVLAPYKDLCKNMASIVTALPPETAPATSTISIPANAETSATVGVHSVPARQEIRMGRAASIGEGINWLTLGVIVAFHIGAIAALFFFSWQRLVVIRPVKRRISQRDLAGRVDYDHVLVFHVR